KTTSHLGVDPQTFMLALNGSVNVLKVIKFNASLSVVVKANAWSFDAAASMDFFGIATLSGQIHLDSEGNFEITLNGKLIIGSSSFGLEGDFHFHLESRHTTDTIGNPYYIFDLSGGASVSVNVFGISLAGVGLDFSFHAEGSGRTPLTLSLTVHIHLLFITISKTPPFTSGSLGLPQPVWLAGAGPPSDASQSTDRSWPATSIAPQQLVLNVGPRAANRNIAVPAPGTSNDDTYLIQQV